MNLFDKIETRLNETIEEDIDILLGTATSPTRFDSRKEFKNHIGESQYISLNKLGCDTLNVPHGIYSVVQLNSRHSVLVPIEADNGDIFENSPDSYEVFTRDLLNNWKNAHKVLSEDETSGNENSGNDFDIADEREEEEGGFSTFVDPATVDRKAIHRAMQQQGISQTELANMVGVQTPAISRILREPHSTGTGDPGGRNPSLDLAGRICNVLNIDMDAAFPDILDQPDTFGKKKREGNRGSGMANAAAGSTKKGKATEKWTKGGPK